MHFFKATAWILLIPVVLLLLPVQVLAEKKITVYTVNYPLFYFAERIGGKHVNAVFPAPEGIDPAFWKPDAATIRKFQQADLIILNGAGYARWTKQASLPLLRTVETSRMFKEDLIRVKSAVTHNHGPGGDHSHGDMAFTTWLDFSLAAQQAEAIYKAFLRKLPSMKSDLNKNFKALRKDLLELDTRMLSLSSNNSNLPLLGSHPVYQYMVKRYKLNLKMVMWEPDIYPEKREWKHIEEVVEDHPANWMIWEKRPLLKSEQELKNIGIQSQIFSPCFARPQHGDFLSIMQQNITNLGTIFN